MILTGCSASQAVSEEAKTQETATEVEKEVTGNIAEEIPASQEEVLSEGTAEEGISSGVAEGTLSEGASEEAELADKGTTQMNENSADMDTVSKNEVEETSQEALKEFVVTPYDEAKTMYASIALNVRKGPGTDFDVVGYLAMAQAVEVTGQADTGWYQIMVDGEAAYVSHRYLSETKVAEQTSAQPAAEAQATAAQPAGQEAANTQTPEQPAAPTAAVAPAGVIMVGDSRCVQMQEAVGGGGCSWICENSKEYTWFTETAIPKFDEYVGNGTKVVINMGVNDPEHYKQYAEFVNAKAAEWAQRGAKTYFVSVNPVWENPYTDQEDVDTFNANVPGMLSGVTWIDTSSWLMTNGYRLLDGLHYDDPTYVNIFNLIMGSL